MVQRVRYNQPRRQGAPIYVDAGPGRGVRGSHGNGQPALSSSMCRWHPLKLPCAPRAGDVRDVGLRTASVRVRVCLREEDAMNTYLRGCVNALRCPAYAILRRDKSDG